MQVMWDPSPNSKVGFLNVTEFEIPIGIKTGKGELKADHLILQNESTEIAGGPCLCFGKIKPDGTTHGDGSLLRWHPSLTASELGQGYFSWHRKAP